MDIAFTNNARPTIGVELELAIVDEETGDLVNAASDILGEIGAPHGGEHPYAKHELFENTIEIITDVCATPADVHADLSKTLAEVRTAAADRGLTLMSSGTHPFARARDQVISPSPRYHRLVDDMQWTARRLLIYGTHVHVGLQTGEQAIIVFNELGRYLPLFLALSASSPYLEAEDTGLASSRSKVFESLPTAGLPPQLKDWGEFEQFMETLLHAECITSVREVWWDVRPHPDFGTVELRMCDAVPTLREATALAALAQAVVVRIVDRYASGELIAPPREWTVRENRWLAARYGIDADLIVDEKGHRRPAREIIEQLLIDLRPVAEALGSTRELAVIQEIVRVGPGYVRHRQLREAGADGREVVASLAAELESDLVEPPR